MSARSSLKINTLAKCTELEHLLMGDLRELLDDPLDATNIGWIQAVLDVLLQTLPREMELHEQTGGYLREVVEEVPCWDGRVDLLRTKKRRLCSRLARMYLMSRNMENHETRIRFQRDLHEWLDELADLHRKEIGLIQDAFNMDIGCGD